MKKTGLKYLLIYEKKSIKMYFFILRLFISLLINLKTLF